MYALFIVRIKTLENEIFYIITAMDKQFNLLK